MRNRWLASSGGARAWLGALGVLVLAAVLVVLDMTVSSVDRYWSRHSFTSSVLSGVLVLLLTVLIADRVTHLRQQRNQARAIAAQAAIIVAQATRTAAAVAGAEGSDDDREGAADELRTYMMMLLTSAPLLIDATDPRRFLEASQRVAVQLSRVLRAAAAPVTAQAGDSIELDAEVEALRQAAEPLLSALKPEERAAVRSARVG